MDIKKFVKDFEIALDDVESGSLSPDSVLMQIKQLDSLGILSIIAMMHKQYNTKIKGSDIKNAITIADLYNLIQK